MYPGSGLRVGGMMMSQASGAQRMPLGQVESYFLQGMRPEMQYMNMARPQVAANPPISKTITIRNYVNLKKNTLKLTPDETQPNLFQLEFMFDASLDCCISIHYAALINPPAEDGAVSFSALTEGSSHPVEHFSEGLGQVFRTRPQHPLDLSIFTEELLTHNASHNRYPVVICLEVAPGASANSKVSSQTTLVDIVRQPGSTLPSLRPLKQKIQVGAHSYELQEIYGIDRRPQQQCSSADDAARSSTDGAAASGNEEGPECVICMTETRDTTVLPCRHMCMCSDCAKQLRLQSNKCPICRTNIQSLLQIKIAGDPGKRLPEAGPPPPAESGDAVEADRSMAQLRESEEVAA